MKRKSQRMKALMLAVCMLVSILGGVSAKPDTVYAADDYPAKYKNLARDACVDEWNFYNRECTSFAAWCLNSRNGVAFHNRYGGVRWGNANNWGYAAKACGITVDMNPAVGSIWWSESGTYGHVAWVSAVDGNNVRIEEYNYGYSGNYHERTVAANSAAGYIHIKDIPQPEPAPDNRYGSRMETGGARTIADGDYHIVSALDTDESSLRRQCLTIASNSVDNEANACLWECSEDDYQVFTVTWRGNGFYEIKFKYSGKSLDVAGGGTLSGTNVRQYEDNDSDAQQWAIMEAADGVGHTIQARCSGHYLDATNAVCENGTNIQMCRYIEENNHAQQWLFIPWGGGNSAIQEIPDGEYEIVSTVDENESLHAASYEIAAGTNVILRERNAGNPTIFLVRYLAKGYYAITEKNSGLSLDVSGGSYMAGANAQFWTHINSDAQQWLLKSCGDGSFNIISKKATYLDDSSGKAEDGANVLMWNGHGLANQKWKLVPYIRAVDVESLVLDQNTVILPAGTQSAIKATIIPENATDKTLIWESTNPTVADIDNNGIVTAKSAGPAIITVKSANGKIAFCQVIVEEDHTHAYADIWGTDAGSHWKECECGEKSEIQKHYFGNWEIKAQATCTDCGLQVRKCVVCGYEETQETARGEHVYANIITRATTKKNGSIVEKCSICGGEKSRTAIYAVSNASLSKTSYTYDGKGKKPSVTVKDSSGKVLEANMDYTVSFSKGRKNVGRYIVTVKLKGNYRGTISKTFDIIPEGTSISKIEAKKEGFTVKWAKQATQTTGYEIAYSTDSGFAKKSTTTINIKKNGTVSKTISKLKAKKKYYVRIRAYKTVEINGKSVKLYSGWSKAKAVTTKE